MLAKYLSDHNRPHKDWDKYISKAVFSYNTSIHPSTGYTPFFLTHGREARIGSESVLMGKKLTSHSYPLYVKQMLTHMSIAHANVKDRVGRKAEERDTINAGLVRKVPLLSVGDVIYIYKLQQSDKAVGFMKKLSSPYEGPYIILQSYNEVSYQAQHQVTKEIVKVHATWIKKLDEKKLMKNNLFINNNNNNIIIIVKLLLLYYQN